LLKTYSKIEVQR